MRTLEAQISDVSRSLPEPRVRRRGGDKVAPHAGPSQGVLPSWEELYEEFGERVFRFIFRMTHDADLAADLTHDTFVRVHERGHQYRGSGAIRAWVFQIAANQVRDHARRRSARWRGLRLLQATPGMTRSGFVDGTSKVVIRKALAELPESQRAVLVLHDVDGFTHAEIGDALGIAEGTSKARLSRARAAMRHILTDNNDEECDERP